MGRFGYKKKWRPINKSLMVNNMANIYAKELEQGFDKVLKFSTKEKFIQDNLKPQIKKGDKLIDIRLIGGYKNGTINLYSIKYNNENITSKVDNTSFVKIQKRIQKYCDEYNQPK